MIPLPEGVRIGSYNKESLKEVWLKLKDFDPLFSDREMKKPEVFLDEFLSQDSLILETKDGIVLLDNIVPDLRGEIHFSFFDRKLEGKEKVMKDILLWFMWTYRLKRIETFIPSYAKAVQRFLEKKLSFKHEGTMRNRVYHKGLLLDIFIYGILFEEVI